MRRLSDTASSWAEGSQGLHPAALHLRQRLPLMGGGCCRCRVDEGGQLVEADEPTVDPL